MIRFNEQRYRFMAENPAGPVGRLLTRTGPRIETAAKVIATQEKLVRTGRYRASIAWRLLSDSRGLILRVGSAVPVAKLLEHGSQPHIISARGRQAGGANALWWNMPNDRGWMVQPDDGRPVRFVRHPGTRPYRVIARAVKAVLKGA